MTLVSLGRGKGCVMAVGGMDAPVEHHTSPCRSSADAEVVISMYAVVISKSVSSTNRTFSFAILYHRNPTRSL